MGICQGQGFQLNDGVFEHREVEGFTPGAQKETRDAVALADDIGHKVEIRFYLIVRHNFQPR